MQKMILTVSPEEACRILNEDQSLLVRKIKPSKLPCECNIYCSGKESLSLGVADTRWYPIESPGRGSSVKTRFRYAYYTKDEDKFYEELEKSMDMCEVVEDEKHFELNGKVVAKFTLNKVEEICWKQDLSNPYVSDNYNLETDTLKEWELRNKSCLENEELEDYLGFDESEFKALGYAWHIDNLVIYDKPKEISEFEHYSNVFTTCDIRRDRGFKKTLRPLTRAPSTYYYVED